MHLFVTDVLSTPGCGNDVLLNFFIYFDIEMKWKWTEEDTEALNPSVH